MTLSQEQIKMVRQVLDMASMTGSRTSFAKAQAASLALMTCGGDLTKLDASDRLFIAKVLKKARKAK